MPWWNEPKPPPKPGCKLLLARATAVVGTLTIITLYTINKEKK